MRTLLEAANRFLGEEELDEGKIWEEIKKHAKEAIMVLSTVIAAASSIGDSSIADTAEALKSQIEYSPRALHSKEAYLAIQSIAIALMKAIPADEGSPEYKDVAKSFEQFVKDEKVERERLKSQGFIFNRDGDIIN